MDYQTIRFDVSEGILTVTLHRPEQMNAFTPEMANELIDAFQRASTDDAIRAVIVTGAGKAFCAGMDLSAPGNVFGLDESLRPTLEDMHERLDDPAIVHGVRDTGGRVTLAIYECTKPVICAINGAAVGIGATMTLAMDIRLASEKARIVGIQQALEWVYTADIFDAREALRGRLVKAVYPPEQLLEEARKLAHKIVDNRSPVAVALTRQMLYRNAAQPHPVEAHRIDSLGMFYTSIGDGKEGVRSFLEKRAPDFTSRASTDLPLFYKEWTRRPE